MQRIVLMFVLLGIAFEFWGLPPVLSKKDLQSHPPRITRKCCAFGSDIKILAVPFLKLNPVIDVQELGSHKYLGGNNEGNGLIYTNKGGFIDLGHLREWADWTAFLYVYIQSIKDEKDLIKRLGVEGGTRKLIFKNVHDLNDEDKILVAAKIAFDLGLWHEIVTGYGVSSAPIIYEKFSSFSAEDIYSNLLGVQIGMEAIKSEKEYDEAVTAILIEKLKQLEVVETIEETYNALEQTNNVWWSRDHRLPQKEATIMRMYYDAEEITPWLIPNQSETTVPMSLKVPTFTSKGEKLDTFYNISIKLNYRIPGKEIVEDIHKRRITHNSFVLYKEDLKNTFEKEKMEEFKK